MNPYFQQTSLYQPLQRGWIRLATLHPGSTNDAIIVTLNPAQLCPQPSQYYEALSYVWGTPGRSGQVIVNGIAITVAPNLALALQSLRFTDRPRTLWVDAICINQVDNAEKSHQVELMATVYKLADKVLIHLGRSKGPSDEEAMETIAAVDRPLTAEITRQVFDSIFTNPWFERVWVVQEAALAKVAIVILGNKAVRWDCFTAWPMRAAPYQIDRVIPGILALPPRFQPVEGSFLQRLHETRPLKATMPSDKVFGLLGLIPDRDPWIQLVDYAMPTARVFSAVAKCFVDHERSLRFLSAVHPDPFGYSGMYYHHLKDDERHLPSWVPDWSVNPDVTPLGIGRDFREPYNAGGYPAVASASGNRLVAKGVLLDTVKLTGSSYDATGSGDSNGWVTLKGQLSQIQRSNTNKQLAPVREWTAGGLSSLLGEIASRIAERPAITSTTQQQSMDSAELRKLARWADMFEAPEGCDPSACCSDARASFRAVTTAAPPTTLQGEEIGCRRWKSKTGIATHLELDGSLGRVCYGRQVFETESGLVGLGPEGMQPGDRVVILLGGPVPYVIRKQKGDEQAHTFIGECYVLGAMGGEGLKHLHDELQALGHYLGPCGPPICEGKLQAFEIV
ncbi:heterokaryon incompatibility protein-domain-containing protein [Immersiella caudata]|uniref:Heterokaryon incompatibility protein-domain-containing protein n=1 Tax=Immersiella caudata TaxID=314043 RepID=A0AA40CCX0_9PEZI|nr:heterokaryon incompatibility protein-domain-containing protein [Immersiella caudata]